LAGATWEEVNLSDPNLVEPVTQVVFEEAGLEWAARELVVAETVNPQSVHES
jgi:hypothetical protein